VESTVVVIVSVIILGVFVGLSDFVLMNALQVVLR
jgi:preprotein translocase subunit SecE